MAVIIMKCPKCGNSSLACSESKYCTSCGTKLVPAKMMKCKCGEEYLHDTTFKFCGICGRELKKKE